MQKRSRKPGKPKKTTARKRTPAERDEVQIAASVIEQATGEQITPPRPDDMPPDAVREFMRQMGARGGKKGGAARAKRMSSEQRSEAASVAARARWAKAKTES